MSDRPFTLIDVMRGVKKHKLADKLTDGVYKFLIELILEANELGFKNPIDLTVKQALAIGGGESRQTLYNRRNSLKKIMLNGKHLVKVKVGSYGQRSLATYEIDYKLLCSYTGVWQGSICAPSNEIDEGFTKPLRSVDVTLDDGLPILRSDQRREDNIQMTDVDDLMMLMQEKWPHPNPPANGRLRRMIDKYTYTACVDAVDTTPDDMRKASWTSIFNYMEKVAKNLKPAPKQLTDEERAVKNMKQAVSEYRSIDPKTNLSWNNQERSFIVSSMYFMDEWYGKIDNFGDIVGMGYEEYSTLREEVGR